jgi:hypothetical protein
LSFLTTFFTAETLLRRSGFAGKATENVEISFVNCGLKILTADGTQISHKLIKANISKLSGHQKKGENMKCSGGQTNCPFQYVQRSLPKILDNVEVAHSHPWNKATDNVSDR